MGLLENVNGLKQTKSYVKLLEGYRESLKLYQDKLEKLDKAMADRSIEEDHLAVAQAALELTLIKEELDQLGIKQQYMADEVQQLKILIKGMEAGQQQVSAQIGQIDNTIIEPIKKNYTANRFSILAKMDEVIATIKTGNRGIKIVLMISMILNLFSACGLTFIILYILGIVSF